MGLTGNRFTKIINQDGTETIVIENHSQTIAATPVARKIEMAINEGKPLTVIDEAQKQLDDLKKRPS